MAPAQRSGTSEVYTMQDQIIDFIQIELYLEEIRYNPADRDPQMDELVKLYRFQQELLLLDEEE